MNYSIDGAVKSLETSLNDLKGVKCIGSQEEAGGKDTFIVIRPAGTTYEPTFGTRKVFSSFSLTTSFQGKNETGTIEQIKNSIVNKTLEDPRRNQNAQETIVEAWEPGDDTGKDGVVEVLTVIIRTEEATC